MLCDGRMVRRSELPHSLRDAPFAVSAALASGVGASRLRAKDLMIPTRGARAHVVPANDEEDEKRPETAANRLERLDRELRERAQEIATVLTPEQFFSHETGLGLVGVPLPFTRDAARSIHVSARHPAPKPRRKGVTGHRLQTREPSRWRAGGLPIEHPARMWRQAAEHWDLDDLIIAADRLVLPRRSLLTMDELRREVLEGGNRRRGLLSHALDEARAGAETAEETRLRLLLVRAGLPEPVLNFELFHAGRFVARLDLAFPRYRVAVEHDGRVHAEDSAQFAKDADRWDDIRATSWHHVRVLSHHMRPDPQVAVDKAARALFDAGWRPGRD